MAKNWSLDLLFYAGGPSAPQPRAPAREAAAETLGRRLSFDLHFHTGGPSAPRSLAAAGGVQAETLERRLRAWLNENVHVRTWARNRGFQASYENADTGVSFSFLHSPGRDGEGQSPQPHAFTGLTLSIPYVRPIFFGMEAVAIVGALCRDFGFMVLDPQADDEGATTPRPCSGEALIESWDRSNCAAIESLLPTMRKKPLAMPRDKAVAWWRYQMLFEQKAHRTGDGTCLPEAYIVFERATGLLRTMTVWQANATQLLPDFDYVLMTLPPKRKSSTRPSWRLVRRKDFVAAMRGRLRAAHLEDDFPGAMLVPESATTAIQSAAAEIPKQPSVENVPSTSFIDFSA